MKRFLAMLCATMLCACCLVLAACGGSGSSSAASSTKADEEAIAAEMQKNVESFNEGIAGGGLEGITSDETVSSLLEMAQVKPEDFVAALQKNMVMEVGEIKVDGDKATVEVTFVKPDITGMTSQLEQAWEKASADLDTSKMTQEELLAEYGKVMISVMESPDMPTASTPFTIEYGKSGGQWSIQNRDELTEAVQNAYSYSS